MKTSLIFYLKNYVIKLNFFLLLFFIISLLSSYKFINSMIPMYLIALTIIFFTIKKLQIQNKNLLGLIFFLVFTFYFIFYSDYQLYSLKILRYYFGFLIFYILFNSLNLNYLNYKKIIIFLIYWVIIESILINTIINPEWITTDFRNTKFLGFYYRPWSFNSNPTATSGIIIFFYYFIEKYLKINLGLKNLILLCLAVLLLFSTTGYLLLFVFLFLKFIIEKKKNIIFKLLVFIIFTLFLIYISNIYPANYYTLASNYINFEKISFKYILHIFEIKKLTILFVIEDLKSLPFLNILLGIGIVDHNFLCSNVLITVQDFCSKLNYNGIGGDFSIINIFHQIGILGILSFVLLLVTLKNNNLRLTNLYLLIFISFFHYSVIFMPLGQLFLGLILSNNFNDFKKN